MPEFFHFILRCVIFVSFEGAEGYGIMNSRRYGRSRIRVLPAVSVFLLTALCIMLIGASPVSARNRKSSSGKKARARIYGVCARSSNRAGVYRWLEGSFQNGGYYDRDGKLVTSFELEDRKPVPKIARLSGKPYLFIGASRTRQYSNYVKDRKTFFYGCSGARFDWFFRCGKDGELYPAYHVIRAYAMHHPGGTVIVDMGGNDIRNVRVYASFYKELMAKFPAVTFYFLMPLPYEIGTQDNGNRLEFCQRIEDEVPGHVLNVFEEVYRRVLLRYPTMDGKHYSAESSRMSYEIVCNRMGRMITVNKKTGKVTG